MDQESKLGVIYFSFGSFIKGHTMPAEKREAFTRTFKKLPQRVIWKWENDTLEEKIDNIFIGKWLPRIDILSEQYFISCYKRNNYRKYYKGCSELHRPN